MTEKERKLFEGFLSKTLKMDGEATSSLFNEEGELISVAPILSADADRMAKKKDEADLEYKKGTAKTMEKLERQLREQYEVDDEELKGVDLVNAIITKQKETAKGEHSTVEIESHPDFIKHRQEWEKKVKETERELKGQLETIEKKHQKDKAFHNVQQKAKAKLLSLNPILPEDAEKAETIIRKLFISELEGYDYDVSDNNIVVKLDGKAVEDSHGNMINFDELVTTTANKYFSFKQSSDRDNSGNSDSGNTRTKHVFKSREDFNEKVKAAKTDAERDVMIDDYRAQQK